MYIQSDFRSALILLTEIVVYKTMVDCGRHAGADASGGGGWVGELGDLASHPPPPDPLYTVLAIRDGVPSD